MARQHQLFDDHADRYDAWYDGPAGRVLLASELACLGQLLEHLRRPYLEIGTGTGRFGTALGIQYGLDPSARALRRAHRRGLRVAQGVGEAAPFRSSKFGGILIAFTLCFAPDPLGLLKEAHRMLTPDGGLVLGELPRGTPWADFYTRRGKESDPLYAAAHFHSQDEVEEMLREAGFQVIRCRSTLFQRPGQPAYTQEEPREGLAPGAGFVAIAAVKAGRS